MDQAIKIIHVLCLMGGGAATIGNAVLMRNVLAEGGPPSELAMRSMRTLGMIGLAAIVLIWVTGVWLTLMRHAGGGLGWQFYAKIAAATLVLGCAVALSYLGAKAGIEGRPPNPDVMQPLSVLSLFGTVAAVAFAIIAFG